MDCGYTGPPFHFDFDHRDPSEKQFKVANYSYGLERLREEASKCDLVCAPCHRTRTHRQRCKGCIDCSNMGSIGFDIEAESSECDPSSLTETLNS